MGITSIWHLLIILIVVLLIFGPGRLSKVMGELGKGVKSLRDGMNEPENKPLPREQAKDDIQPPPA